MTQTTCTANVVSADTQHLLQYKISIHTCALNPHTSTAAFHNLNHIWY